MIRDLHAQGWNITEISPATLRYETKPGVQAQVDWSEFGKVGVDGKIQKLYCFNMILGYSRMSKR